MDDPNAPAEKLTIRCPGCGQRFNVGMDLRDRMVECGTCEHRFRVNDEVVLRTKKFYPGERHNRGLDGFSRVPKTIGSDSPGFQTVQYNDDIPARGVEPTSPLRLIFGFIAVAIMVMVALMLIYGGSASGLLFGTGQTKRLMLAGFTALIGGALLVAANPLARGRAVLGALAAAAGLISLPYVFTEGTAPVVSMATTRPDLPVVAEMSPADKELDRLKGEIGYEPLEREMARFGSSSSSAGRSAAGIWLRGLREFHKLQIRDYIIRATGADPSSHMYPRPPDYLMVVSGVTDDLSELALLCQRFGEVRRTIEPLRVIEVVVNNDSFVEGPHEKLNDATNPAFYELNRRELESIDLERARRAVGRLAEAPPKVYRKDVVKRMQQLLREGDEKLQAEVSKALVGWGEPGDGSEDLVRAAAEEIVAAGSEPPEPMIAFLVTRKDLAAIPLIDGLWSRDFTKWEGLYAGLGSAIEDKVLARYGNASVTHRMSAIRVLGEAGTAKSIKVLEGSREAANPEVRVLIDRALAAIRGRE